MAAPYQMTSNSPSPNTLREMVTKGSLHMPMYMYVCIAHEDPVWGTCIVSLYGDLYSLTVCIRDLYMCVGVYSGSVWGTVYTYMGSV